MSYPRVEINGTVVWMAVLVSHITNQLSYLALVKNSDNQYETIDLCREQYEEMRREREDTLETVDIAPENLN